MGLSASQQMRPIMISVQIKYQVDGLYRQLLVTQGSMLIDIVDDFMKLFKDMIPHESNASDFKFQLVTGPHTIELLPNNYKLQNHDLLVASFRLDVIHPRSGPVIDHEIVADTPYFMWSMCSQINDALMVMKNSTTKLITCDGKVTDNHIQFTAKDVSIPGGRRYAFTLPSGTPNRLYVLKGQGENSDIIAEELEEKDISSSMPDEYKFQAVQFFSYMQYRCDKVGGRDDLYISALQDGTVSLQKAGVQGYPRPSTLFIAANII